MDRDRRIKALTYGLRYGMVASPRQHSKTYLLGEEVTADEIRIAYERLERIAMAKFSQQHYEALATMMQRAHPQEYPENDNQWSRNQWGWGVDMMVQMLKHDNPQFKEQRFRKACQPGNNVRARKHPDRKVARSVDVGDHDHGVGLGTQMVDPRSHGED